MSLLYVANQPMAEFPYSINRCDRDRVYSMGSSVRGGAHRFVWCCCFDLFGTILCDYMLVYMIFCVISNKFNIRNII